MQSHRPVIHFGVNVAMNITKIVICSTTVKIEFASTSVLTSISLSIPMMRKHRYQQ
jgi:hypothetical protein